MCRRMTPAVLLGITAAWLGAPAVADIVSIAGAVQVVVTEYYLDAEHDTERVSESYPDTAATLPIQVAAHLSVTGSNLDERAGGAVGAQFADPSAVTTPNPEEFAINLALHSTSPDTYHTGYAIASETRAVTYSATDLGLAADSTESATVTGRLFLDGAFTIFTRHETTDLTDSYVRMRVTVVKRVAGHDDVTVFTGELRLGVDDAGAADVSALGSFPTNRLVLSNLSLTSVLFEVFHVLVLPNLQIDYTYEAAADEEFSLVATMEVWAENAPGGGGVGAVLGTPTDSLTQVIDLTLDQQAAKELVSKLNAERANPTGKSAFPTSGLSPLLPSCGLFGFEMLVGMAALVGLKSRPIRRGRN